MKLKFFVCTALFASSVSLISCKDNLAADFESKPLTQETSTCINLKALLSENHTMNIEEAKDHAYDAADLLFSNKIGLKNSESRRISNVSVLTKKQSNSLRNSEEVMPDTLAYFLNFENNSGYAIVCADDRVGCPILACTDNGSIDLNTADTDQDSINPGLAMFIEDIEVFIRERINKFESEKDSLTRIAEAILKDHNDEASLRKVYSGKYTLCLGEESAGPLLKTKWGQGSPYNDNLSPCSQYTKQKTGCWATAIAQFIAYKKYPEVIDNYKYNLSDLSKIEKINNNSPEAHISQVSKLMHTIGKNVKMDYGCSSSSARDVNTLNWMEKLGYKTRTEKYTFNQVKYFLDRNYPIIATGKKKMKRFLGIGIYAEGGHAFLIDGYKTLAYRQETYKVDTDKGTQKITSSKTYYENALIHINWGWDGQSNGYFADGCFNSKNYQSLDNPQDGISNRDYKYNKMIHLIWR